MRVLEVGGRPYLLAALIEHFLGYDVHVANEPGAVAGEEDDVVTLVSDDGSEYSFPQARLDIEHEQWPWPDGSFDLVVYWEVIEHLAYDPTHTLVEAHRVLEPDTGTLLLSTPNALAWQYLVGILRGRNPFPPYVGYGPHARHHRLFSLVELRHLVEQVGFEVTRAFTAYDPSYLHSRRLDPVVRRPRRHLRHRRRRTRSTPTATPTCTSPLPRSRCTRTHPSSAPASTRRTAGGQQTVPDRPMEHGSSLRLPPAPSA